MVRPVGNSMLVKDLLSSMVPKARSPIELTLGPSITDVKIAPWLKYAPKST